MESKYKVGDIVTIKRKREGSKDDYRFCFTDRMVEEYGGKSHRIIRIEKEDYTPKTLLIPDDGHRYYLEDNTFTWASSMFEDPSEVISLETSIDNNLDAFIAKKKRPELDFTL